MLICDNCGKWFNTHSEIEKDRNILINTIDGKHCNHKYYGEYEECPICGEVVNTDEYIYEENMCIKCARQFDEVVNGF